MTDSDAAAFVVLIRWLSLLAVARGLMVRAGGASGAGRVRAGGFVSLPPATARRISSTRAWPYSGGISRSRRRRLSGRTDLRPLHRRRRDLPASRRGSGRSSPRGSAFQELAGSARQALSALPRGTKALVVAPAGCGDRRLCEFGALTAFALTDRARLCQHDIRPERPSADRARRIRRSTAAPTIVMDDRWLTEAGRAALALLTNESALGGRFRGLAAALHPRDRRARGLPIEHRRPGPDAYRRRRRASMSTRFR